MGGFRQAKKATADMGKMAAATRPQLDSPSVATQKAHRTRSRKQGGEGG